jgi:hypothetical protein
MRWQQIRRQITLYFRSSRRRRIYLSREDLNSTHLQLERMIDYVCNRHSVARVRAEQEIYDGLQRVAARPSDTNR